MPDEPLENEHDEEDSDENLYPPRAATEHDIEKLEIDVREDPFQVSAIVQKIERGQLVLTPGFQRNEVWDLRRRSEFIESILLNYPLPPLYLNQDKSGRYIVVDGLQRSSSIFRFLRNEYELTGLERLAWLNGKRFADLDAVLQARIEDRKLNCYVLKPSVPMGVIYDIFARINRGGIPLNRQEIRHGLNQGKSTELLARIAEVPAYRYWIGLTLGSGRMRDQEAALRCIAFAAADVERDYVGDMDKFLETAMMRLNRASNEEIAEVERTFVRVWVAARGILGDGAFRIPTSRTRGQLNVAIMESAYRFFAVTTDKWLQENAVRVAENYRCLLGMPQFLAAVQRSTGDKAKVLTRFLLAREVLGGGRAD